MATVQDIRDSAKRKFGLTTTDTDKDAGLLDGFNEEVWPKVRSIIIDANEFYFDLTETQDLTSGTDAYTLDYRIRKIHAVKVKFSSGDRDWFPIEYRPDLRRSVTQVNSTNTTRVRGWFPQGPSTTQIILRDIPDQTITNGLYVDYTPDMTALGLVSTIPMPADFHFALVSGMAMVMGELSEEERKRGYYYGKFMQDLDLVERFAERLVDAEHRLSSGVPMQMD